jgi:hypothetical protein
MGKQCQLCGLEITDGQSRVIYPPGDAHRKCRDAKQGRVPRVNPNASIEEIPSCTTLVDPDVES